MVRKRCLCGNHPIYNVPGGNPICCRICKTIEMINVMNKKCPCGTRPSFNIKGETTGVCCSKCKTPDMIDVKNKRCPCGSLSPIFNIPGKSKGICCRICKTDEMVDVVSKRCLCGKQPNFNAPGEKLGICCLKCKTNEMINVVSKRCSCGRQPCFNTPGETKGVCCMKCKTDDMIDVKNRRCPGYNTECPVRTLIGNGSEYCMSCDPNDDRRKRYKLFEEAFFDYVKNRIIVHMREFHIPFDPSETAKKFARLDGIVFGDGIIVCLEVDENGHRDYECDEHRMNLATAELLQKYPDKAVSWVRVNPTVDAKNQWSKTSKKIREKRFEEVVTTVKDILKMRDTRVEYIGFK